MKTFIFLLISFVPIQSTDWQLDFEKAKQMAQAEHKLILINFSGSDWCGPCIRMHKEILDTDAFGQFAKDRLVLVSADFPRSKKNALSSAQQKKNDQLAETYNNKGAFPLTLLLTADGKLLKTWDGLPKLTTTEFTQQIQSIIDASH
jgi:thioredoxin-related protein